MRRLLIALLALVILVIGVAFVAPALIPTDVIRERTETAATDALGRDVILASDIRLQVLPQLQVRAQDARIANAPGFGEEPFAQMQEMRVSVALIPLLQRQIEIEEFVLVDPVIRLQSNTSGNNWTFGDNAEAEAQANGEDGFQRRPGALPFEASFGDVRIENGAVIFDDGVQTRRFDALDLSIDLPSVDQPVRLRGSFEADGRPMDFNAELGSLRGFFEGQETAFSTTLNGPLADLTLDGRFLESAELAFDGEMDVTLPLRALARYLGADLPDGDIFRQFSARSAVSGEPGLVRLNDARISFDDINARGGMTLNYSGARPRITGELSTALLDLTPYIPAESAPDANRSGGSGISEWSDEPMDLAPLRTVDTEITIRADELKARDIEVSDVTALTTLDQGRLTARLNRFQLYGGAGEAVAVINARGNTPSFSFNANLDSLQAQPFLLAAAQFDRLIGDGGFTMDLTANGASPAAIMNSLSGTGRFEFNDGAIQGVNLAQMIRTVQTALQNRALPTAFAESEQTDFSTLGGSFTVTNGVVSNQDLQMLSPLLRVLGNGQIDLGAQSIDYRLTPRAVQSLTGQGGQLDLQGLEVPVRLEGGFNNVSARIDFEAVARNLLSQKAGRLLRQSGDGEAEDESPATPEDVVRGLFGQLLNNSRDSSEETPDEEDGGEQPN
ncbi:AsmA family protein [Oceanicaulis sp. MMSF_3324]|uniref:AsmA family protein n=1 Tax=Oceanicaulis sp. MMSF_3324 TaxID=3046702 RepID=UPI00273FC329|nr:AsmA family protein [Oceanicaulis sp. MMSF_3324]